MAKDNPKTAAVEETVAVNTENAAATEVVETVEETPTDAVVETVEGNSTDEVVETVEGNSTDEVVETVDEIQVQEAEIIPSGVFVSESGDEYEFTVAKFLFRGKKYQVEEAIANHSDVLEELVSLKSFILKLR
ncbi:MAG: hypothetical protein V4670_12165 [Bacteroidota bacterium]